MALTLEQTLAQVAADNNLTHINVGRSYHRAEPSYTACVHWDGFAKSGVSCAHGYGDTSIAEALTNAISKAQSDRIPTAAVVAEVPAFEVAA